MMPICTPFSLVRALENQLLLDYIFPEGGHRRVFLRMPHIKGSFLETPHTRCRAVYFDALCLWGTAEGSGKGEMGNELMNNLWQEVGILLSSGAIGSLLVWGYQNWLKK
jgi:hypothetical protein